MKILFQHSIAIVVVLFSITTTVAYAQTNATITGMITDPSKGAVPGAAVSVTNTDTGLQRKTTSNQVGYFTVGLLQPGNYEILVEKDGFQPLTRSGITLTVDQIARVDLMMGLGAVSEAITVKGEVQMLQTDTPEASAVITTAQYDRLPLLQTGRIRTPASFIYLAPRVQGDVNENGTDNTAATNYFRIGGGEVQETEVMVEGMVTGRTQYIGSFNEIAPSVDAVREFKATTSLMSAESGHSGQATIDFQLKSGTNEFHGSLFEYLRNDKLDAREWTAAKRTVTRQNEFGGTIGGPILIPRLYRGKDKTFFFFSYSGSRKRGATTTSAVQIPTPQNLAGDFSATSQLIYDPASTRLDSQGRFIRDPFPGNKIPSARIDPVAAAFFAPFQSADR